jgi:hypothetical protein
VVVQQLVARADVILMAPEIFDAIDQQTLQTCATGRRYLLGGRRTSSF